MKRFIIIASVILSTIGILITASPFLLRISGLDEPLKRQIIPKLIDNEKGHLNIEDFSVGLGKLKLRDVSLSSNDKQFNLLIQSIDFNFNFFDLFLNIKKPQIAVNSIYLVEPRLILKQVTDDSLLIDSDPAIDELHFRDIFEKLSEIRAVDHIKIKNGRIIWKNKSGAYIALVNQLNGDFDSRDFDRIKLQAQGRIFSSSKNDFSVSSLINLNDNHLNAQIEINDYFINNTALPYFTKEFRLRDGFLSGKVKIENTGFNLDSLRINGQLTVSDFAFTTDMHHFSNVGFGLIISDSRMKMTDGQGKYLDTPFTIRAEVKNLLKPALNGDIVINNLPLAYFEDRLETDIFNGSEINARIAYQFDPSTSKISADISSKILTLKDFESLNNFQAKLIWMKNEIRIKRLSGILSTFKISGNGRYQIEKKNLSFSLFADKKLLEHQVFDQLTNRSQRIECHARLNTENLRLLGRWQYTLYEPDTLLYMQGELRGNRENLTVVMQKSNAADLKLYVNLIDYIKNPTIHKAHLDNFPFHYFVSEPLLKRPLEKYSAQASLRGSFNKLSGTIKLVDRANEERFFNVNTTINNLLKKNKQINGNIRLKHLTGFYEFDLSNDFFGGSFQSAQGIDGDLYFDLKKEEQLSGIVNFHDFNILPFFKDSASTDDFRMQGRINGAIEIGGRYDDPNIKADLYGDKFVFNDIGYYRAELKMQADRFKARVDTLVFSLNNIPILGGNVDLSLLNKRINAKLQGHNVDAEKLLTTFVSDRFLLSGRADYVIKVNGKLDEPQIETEIDIRDGVLDRIPFDNLSIAMRDNINEAADYFSPDAHKITIDHLFFEKTGRFSLTGVGKLPLNSSDPIDILINFRGDALGFIPQWVSFFKDATSNTSIEMHVVGSRDQIRIESAYAQIERGELWLRNVAPHIKNINGVIEKKSGSNHVNFVDLKASVKGETLTINTVRDVTMQNGTKIEPWYFDDLDLDFGVLKLETAGGGVELHLPGLMYPDDAGELFLTGKQEGESFYFAGPVKHPLARGTITLYNTSLTFPFITRSKPGEKDNTAVEFLKNMNWDVLVKSGEDVLYVREIPAYVDNVYTELFVDETSSGLEFEGIIDKGSFNATGKLISSRGRLEYLDQNFKVERFAVEFNEYEALPVISGRAWTTIRDSVGALPKTIYLKLYAVDQEGSGEKQQGRWEDFKFKLESADPQIGESQEQVLAYLGFSVGNIKAKATSVGGAVTEKWLIRPLLRPLERTLEKNLGLDLVRINSNIAKNLFYSSLGNQEQFRGYGSNRYVNPFSTNLPYLYLMQSSELTIGKYITQNLYLTYTGQLVSVYDQDQTSFDFNHSFGIEYRFLRNVLLELEYDRELMGYYHFINERQYLNDLKIRVRHSFTF